ncbi:MAG: hypothetical protein HY817_00875 [Candidatus Abawacabacteria bacterium]|nr:hypothetical protein [Candidatus Abawacabacteria bacterium]
MLVSQVAQSISQYLTFASVERIEDSQALLKLDGTGETVYWPLSHLPAHIETGMQISIQFGDEKLLKQERDMIAHNVLQQLMQ